MATSQPRDEQEQVQAFVSITEATSDQAQQYLTANDFNLMAAVESYFADQEDSSGEQEDEPLTESVPEPEPASTYSGPRTLDGRPAPQSTFPASSSSARAAKPPRKTGIATLGSISAASGGGGHGHDHSDDDDDEDEDDSKKRGPRDLFAGGEKSGLAVQDPNNNSSKSQKVIKDILEQAKANAKRVTASSSAAAAGPSRSSQFQGSGQTLGGEGVESRVIPDPRGSAIPRAAPPTGPVQERILHLWSDGFSIDDGPLRRFDSPEHAMDLQMIRQGRAPLHLMNVEPNQPVDVKLQQHDEDWRQLPKIYRPFAGTGNRLGSPVPGIPQTASTSSPAPAAPSASATGSGAAPSITTQVDESQPTVMIRMQMPDGSRLPARFNTTATIGDLYDFVTRASTATHERPFMVLSTFPSKEYSDKSVALADVDAFKKGGTAVVKWA